MRKHWLLIVLLALPLAAQAADNDCSNATPAQAKALMQEAAAQLQKLGPEKAFTNFMDPEGEFFPRDLYVFVVDFDGKMWVNGAFPQAIGSNAMEAQDNTGRHYIEEILKVARQHGEGQIEYMWINPCTGEYTDKLTFFKRVDRFVVAVGAYRSKSTRSARLERTQRDIAI